jgi:hypothetical protein
MLDFRPTALALAMLVLSSCAYAPGGKSFPWGVNFSGEACKDSSAQYLEGVDWNQARVLSVRIRQGLFSPTYLGLYMGQPYILRIENADDADHSFHAFDFFRAVAIAGVSADGGDFQEVDCIAGVTIPPRTKTALRFVAVRDGTYEFDDDSLMNSLAMIGSGGGFITIEPRRRIIESPRKHLNLFDHKPNEIRTERTKQMGLDGGTGPVMAPDDSPKKLSDDPKNTTLNQPSSAFDSPALQQPIDRAPSQPVAISPLSEMPPLEGLFDAPSEMPVVDQAPETQVAPRDETEEEIFVEKVPEVEEAPVTPAIVEGLTQPDTPEAIPKSFQLLEGPPADVYSDPPDGVKAKSGSDGDGGEDKLDSSG